VEGQASISSGQQKKPVKLVHGPIFEKSIIILEKNARVKLIRSKSEICDINKPGKYMVNQLTYENTGNNSILSRFCEYFHSFFSTHTSPEAKSSYKNSISAISRGKNPVPKLDFPLQGALTKDAGPITFMWSHPCTTCTFVLSIYDFTTKERVFFEKTKSKEIAMPHPENILKEKMKYYWKVEIEGQDLECLVNTFEISSSGHFSETITNIEYRLGIDEFKWVNPTARSIYVMSELAEQHQLNYAIQYGKGQQSAYPENAELKDLTDKILFSKLLNNVRD
jgi:hypothetical protein